MDTKQNPYLCCLPEPHFRSHLRHTKTETEGIEKVFHANRNQNKAGVAILIWGKTNFLKIETVTKTKKDTL